MWTIQFLKDLIERALKSAAQALVLVLTGNGFDFWHADWKMVLGVIGSAALLSAATSVLSAGLSGSSLPIGSPGTASLTKAVEPAGEPPSGVVETP